MAPAVPRVGTYSIEQPSASSVALINGTCCCVCRWISSNSMPAARSLKQATYKELEGIRLKSSFGDTLVLEFLRKGVETHFRLTAGVAVPSGQPQV